MLSARALQGLKIVALIASPHTGQAVSSKQLSLQLGLSVSYIENLLKTLKQNDLVVANRGPGGGYLLHKPVDKLSVWDVVRC
ncbi:MAG: Rrf2 family transcriptional regulator, partial [Betaproteobacteria bacterium]|nr:Rrf2 family transcriptional regulator [Betaproteobacteria bacterium]